MIRYVEGDLLRSEAQVLVNTVNCVGADGAGLAKQFRRRYPGLGPAYREACRRGEVRIGRCWSWRAPDGKIICCFPTKQHWRDPSAIAYIDAGLRDLRERLERNPHSIAIPPLGCGLGRLSWVDVRYLIEEHLSDLPIDIFVYGEANLTPIAPRPSAE